MSAEPVSPVTLQAPPHVEVALARVYVWEIPVRVCHWLIVASMTVLAVTGIYIGTPFLIASGPASQRFVMGTMRAVHFYSAIVFTLAVLSRILWMFVGNKYAHWDKFIPVRGIRRRGLIPTLKFYLFAAKKPPGFVGHNPVAGLAYTVVYGLCLLEIATGLALYSVSAHVGSPLRAFGFLVPLVGGLQTARLLHHVSMWLLIAFTVHHVYSAVLMAHVEANSTVGSIVSGWKFVDREDLVYSGYRFIDRETDRGG
jgi:Ni/Fe-hydrogenase 1 B-type cytochrome subunit